MLLDITDVAYAPDATCNLLSPAMLVLKAKLYGEWNGAGMTIKEPQGIAIGFPYHHSGVYHLDCVVPSNGKEIALWHRRLGHLGWENMRKLLGMSTGCALTDEQVRAKLRTICPICAVTKAIVTIPRDSTRRKATELGELIHVDQWGPYAVTLGTMAIAAISSRLTMPNASRVFIVELERMLIEAVPLVIALK